VAERLEAMQVMQAASFGVPAFEAVRAEYHAVLRKVAQDKDQEIRQRALGILAREHDATTQQMLIDGLRDSKKALVPPEKALQLLSYDPHAGAYSAARDVMKTPPSEDARRAALQLLASDPSSTTAFEKILADKAESPELRRVAATALHSLSPAKLQSWAQQAVMDKGENDELLATCLTALDQFGEASSIRGNAKLGKRISQMKSKGSAKVKALAKQVATKYGL